LLISSVNITKSRGILRIEKCIVSIVSSLDVMRSLISEIPSCKSDAFNPDLGRLDTTLSWTWLNTPTESAQATTTVDGFVGFQKVSRENPNWKCDVFSVTFTPILGINPVESLNALHEVTPAYWLPLSAVALDCQNKKDN
jgi:hypothetical protein